MIITLRNDLVELPRLSAALADFTAANGISPRDGFELGLVLEEIFVNIVNYAFADRGQHDVQMQLALDAGAVEVEVTDGGRAFDPFDIPRPDLNADIEDRPIGGLGVHLVRTLTEDLAYERRAGINHLSFRKKLKQADGGGRGHGN